MVVPRKRGTKAAQGQRRSHINLKSLPIVFCDHCGYQKVQHRACKNCGFYAGKEVINVLAKELKKKDKKRKS